jgi:hypothetical protein
VAKLLNHRRGDGSLHTKASTENGPASNQHATAVGKGIDEGTSDGDDGAKEQGDSASEAVPDPRCNGGRYDLGCYNKRWSLLMVMNGRR